MADAEAQHNTTRRVLEQWTTSVDPEDEPACELLVRRAADRHGYATAEINVTVTDGLRWRTYHG